jgi:hypothetical protein
MSCMAQEFMKIPGDSYTLKSLVIAVFNEFKQQESLRLLFWAGLVWYQYGSDIIVHFVAFHLHLCQFLSKFAT